MNSRNAPSLYHVALAWIAMGLDRAVAVAFISSISLNPTFTESSTQTKVVLAFLAVVAIALKDQSRILQRVTKRAGVGVTLQLLTFFSSVGLFLCALGQGTAVDLAGVTLSLLLRPTEPAVSSAIAMAQTPIGTLTRTRIKSASRRVGTLIGVYIGSMILIMGSIVVLRAVYAVSCALYFALFVALFFRSKESGYGPVAAESVDTATGSGGRGAGPTLVEAASTPSLSIDEGPRRTATPLIGELFGRLGYELCAAMIVENLLFGMIIWYCGGEADGYAALRLITFFVLEFVALALLTIPIQYSTKSTRFTRAKLCTCVIAVVTVLFTTLTERGMIEHPLPFHVSSFVKASFVIGVAYSLMINFVDDPIVEYCRVVFQTTRHDADTDEAHRERFIRFLSMQSIGDIIGWLIYVFAFDLGVAARASLVTMAVVLYAVLAYGTRRWSVLYETSLAVNLQGMTYDRIAAEWDYQVRHDLIRSRPAPTSDSSAPVVITVTEPSAALVLDSTEQSPAGREALEKHGAQALDALAPSSSSAVETATATGVSGVFSVRDDDDDKTESIKERET